MAVGLADFERARAIHPHWKGVLRLWKDGRAMLEIHGSTGGYTLEDGWLTVKWDKYQPDRFFQFAGIFVHEKLLREAAKLDDLYAVALGEKSFLPTKISLQIPGADYEVSLRLHGSDVPTFKQVFVLEEYASPNLPRFASTIVDLGANIGLATVFFGLKYPQARVLAVEPEAGNHAALLLNTAALGARVQSRQAAIWSRDGVIDLRTTDAEGSALDAWAVQVAAPSGGAETTKAYALGTLLDEAGFDRVDILKVDIEGAEYEVFSEGCDAWLDRIEMVIVETHDRFRPGSEAAVRSALAGRFEELPASGENLFFRRLR